MASEGDLEGSMDFKVTRWGVASWMFTRPRRSTTSPRRHVDDEDVECDGVCVWMAFGKWKTEEYLVSEPNADQEEAVNDASAFSARAISSSRTFRDNQEEGGIEE